MLTRLTSLTTQPRRAQFQSLSTVLRHSCSPVVVSVTVLWVGGKVGEGWTVDLGNEGTYGWKEDEYMGYAGWINEG